MRFVTTIIIGAGQAGLAMSKHLTNRSIDHVLLERGEVANSWKHERWNSLRLLTPNWQSRLPGFSYSGSDPDGFMTMPEVNGYLDAYSDLISAPVQTHTKVISVQRRFGRYIVKTNRETWASVALVIASGACNLPNIPNIAGDIPTGIEQLSPLDYKTPDQLADGGVLVVGASATGVQLARELQESGRQVTLSAGEHIRMPRRYRGKDIKFWMEQLGLLDLPYTEVEDLNRARKLSSLQLVGSNDLDLLDINALTKAGVDVTGRLSGLRDQELMFSGSLANMCSLADLKMNRLLESIDELVAKTSIGEAVGPAHRFEPTQVNPKASLKIDLGNGQIKTIIWATGFRPDYSWLDLPVLDRKGNIQHDGGVVDMPRLYVMGLPYMRTRKSTLIDGVGDDAEFLSGHLAASLEKAAA